MESPSKAQSQATVGNVLIVIFLTTVTLLTSVDASAIDGVVPLIQTHFNINGAQAATIRTATSAVHTATLAVMWIFGEAIGRRTLYLLSLVAWIVFAFLSVVLGSQSFAVFVALRSLSSAANAIQGVLYPVILADLFRDRALGVALMAVSVCEMVSMATISVIYSSLVVSSGLPWQTALLPGPLFALIPLIGLMCLMKKARRGSTHGKNIFSGAFKVFSNKSFVVATIADSLGKFHLKALLFWFPSVILSAMALSPGAFMGLSYPSVTALNSLLILAGNVIGMPLVLWIAQSWHHGTGLFSRRTGYINAYPICVGAGGLIETAAFAFDVLILDTSFAACFIPNIFAGIGAAAQACLGKLMILMALPNHSRTAAMALLALASGIVSTPSAQIIGFLSDTFRGPSTLEEDRFHAYQLAMLCSAFFMFSSALCFFLLIAFFERDCKRAEKENAAMEEEAEESTQLIGESKTGSVSTLYSTSRTSTVESSQ